METETKQATEWWIYIERDHGPDAMVGPYPEGVAQHALNNSLLIDSLCADDALDCYTTTDNPTGDEEVYIVNLEDPNHTGLNSGDA